MLKKYEKSKKNFGFSYKDYSLWAKPFLELDASDIGHAMCCYPDFAMAKVFHSNLKLIRTKFLMKGDDFCDSTYIWEE